MNLKHLKDSELLSQTKALVQSERLLLTKVLHHLREVERRRLFSDLGYQSLFEYAVKELKYSEGQAGRRIQAMRLLKELPEIEDKIASGALSLSNISQAQSYFRSVQKKSSSRQISINLDSTQTDSFISHDGTAVNISNSNLTKKTIDDHSPNKSEKLRLLESLENKSAREGQKLILSIQPEALPRKERERILSDDSTEIKFVITAELKEKLNELRALLGTQGATISFSELISYMADVSIQETKIKKFGKKRVLGATGARKASSPLNKHGDLNANEANKNAESQVGSKAKIRIKEVIKDIDKQVGRSSKEAREGELIAKVTDKDVNNKSKLKNRETGKGPVDQVASMRKFVGPVRSTTTPTSELLRSNGRIRCPKKTVSIPASELGIPHAKVVSRASSCATPTLESRRRKKSGLSYNPRYISQALRYEVWVRDGGLCTKCGSQRHLNIDHIKPLAIGGETSLNNLRLLCFHCNQRQALKTFGPSRTQEQLRV